MGGFTRKNLIAALIVGNEAERYLREVLAHLQTYVDGLAILDDGSTDGTEKICLEQPKLVAFKKRPVSGFWLNEAEIRQELWAMVEEVAPDWVLTVDADEIFEDEIKTVLPGLLQQERFLAIRFPVCHFWGDRRHIRVDEWWNPRKNYEILLFRHLPGRTYHWRPKEPNCGRHPVEILFYPSRFSHVRLFHYGWASPEELKTRYAQCLGNGNNGRWRPLEHSFSLMGANPALLPWDDGRLRV